MLASAVSWLLLEAGERTLEAAHAGAAGGIVALWELVDRSAAHSRSASSLPVLLKSLARSRCSLFKHCRKEIRIVTFYNTQIALQYSNCKCADVLLFAFSCFRKFC
jgi:hypothetical protein